MQRNEAEWNLENQASTRLQDNVAASLESFVGKDAILYYIITILYYISLYYTILYYTILYYTILTPELGVQAGMWCLRMCGLNIAGSKPFTHFSKPPTPSRGEELPWRTLYYTICYTKLDYTIHTVKQTRGMCICIYVYMYTYIYIYTIIYNTARLRGAGKEDYETPYTMLYYTID